MKRFGAILVLALALAACETRAEVNVNPDGSGTFGFVLAYGDSFATKGMAEPVRDIVDQFKDGPVPFQVTPFREDGLTGYRLSTGFASLDELREMMRQTADNSPSFLGEADNLGDNFVISEAGDGWNLRAQGQPPGSGVLNRPEAEASSPFDADMQKFVDQVLRFQFRITLPGYPAENNADEVKTSDGKTTFVWRSGQFRTETIALRAQTSNTRSGKPVVPILAMAGLAGVGIAVAKRRAGSGRRRGGPPPVVLEGMPALRAPVSVGAPASTDTGPPTPSEPGSDAPTL